MAPRKNASRSNAARPPAPAPAPTPPADPAIPPNMLDEIFSDEDWQRLFYKLSRSRSVRAAELLLRYRFGPPR